MKILLNLTSLLLVLSLFLANSVSACNSTNTSTQSNLSSQEEFGPLQIVIADLTDSINLINEGNKKTAITILKSAKNELRNVSEITSRMKKGMGQRLQKAINAVKKGDNTTALDEINHVLSELQAL